MENPEIGDSLGGGKRKIRLGVKSKGGGKRGGLMVITLNVLVETTDTCVNLLTIYDKKEYKMSLSNISIRLFATFSCLPVFILFKRQ